MFKNVLVSIHFISISIGFAASDHPKTVTTPPVFDQLKGLVGTWEGTTKENDKEMKVEAKYELTSGGTAVVERLFVGKPHEMVTVYYANGKDVGLTHYCAMGNQPHMKLKSSKNKTLAFEMVGTEGIKSKKEAHMHGLNLTVDGTDQLKQEWSYFENGKAQPNATVIVLNRKK